MYELMAAIVVLIILVFGVGAIGIGWTNQSPYYVKRDFSLMVRLKIYWLDGVKWITITLTGVFLILSTFSLFVWALGTIGRYFLKI